MKPEDALEFTQSVAQVVSGGWRLIAHADKLGVPKALGLSVDQWVKQTLGGYVKLSLADRRQAVADLIDQGVTANTQIAAVLGVDEGTIRHDKHDLRKIPTDDAEKPRQSDADSENSDPLDVMTGLAADDAVRKEVQREQRRDQRDADRQVQRAAAAQSARERPPADTDAAICHADLEVTAATLAPGSVDLIFTDPPYLDKTLHVYDALGRVAARVLKDGASLITYISHHRLPDVMAMLQGAGLKFFWPLAVVYTSGQLARMTEYGIIVDHKPLLWFVKGPFRLRTDIRFVHDVVESSQPDKTYHPWQQGVVEARYYIEQLTQPGDLVFDPFCGGGTTAVAAAQTDRRYLTCDVDEEAVWIARQRLREAVSA